MTMRATLYPELAERTEGLGRRGQVLAGIWAGKGTKEIGAELGLSPKTVEYHRAQLYRVFGVSDPVSLCRRAIAVGLINPNAEIQKPKSDPLSSPSGSPSASDYDATSGYDAARVRGPKESRKPETVSKAFGGGKDA